MADAITASFALDLRPLQASARRAQAIAKSMAGAVAGILNTGLAVGGAAAAAGIYKTVRAARDLSETVSKAEAIFGGASNELRGWAEGAAKSFGQGRQQALDAAAGFGIFGKAAGLTGKDLTAFSMRLTELAGDFASFYNTSPEAAISAIGAALRGEAEPIRAFGVLMDEAALRAEALKLGLIATTEQGLTPQQKVLASYNLILAQTKDAQGDFSRTSDGLANATRIFQAQLENLSTEVGQHFLPAAVEMVNVGNEILEVFRQHNVVDRFVGSLRRLPAVIDEARASFAEALLIATKLTDLFMKWSPVAFMADDFGQYSAKDVGAGLEQSREDSYDAAAAHRAGLGPKVETKQRREEKRFGVPPIHSSSTATGISAFKEAFSPTLSGDSPTLSGDSAFLAGGAAFAPDYLSLAPPQIKEGQSSSPARLGLTAGVRVPSALDMFEQSASTRKPSASQNPTRKFTDIWKPFTDGMQRFSGFKTAALTTAFDTDRAAAAAGGGSLGRGAMGGLLSGGLQPSGSLQPAGYKERAAAEAAKEKESAAAEDSKSKGTTPADKILRLLERWDS